MTIGGIAIGAAGLWLVAALVLGLGELVAPGVFLVFLAIAEAMTGAAAIALPALPLAVQLASFAMWSVVAVLIGRRWYADFPVASTDTLLNDRAARLVGTVVAVETAIRDGHGRVRVGDGSWPARGDDASPGETVRVIGVVDGVVEVARIVPPVLPRGG